MSMSLQKRCRERIFMELKKLWIVIEDERYRKASEKLAERLGEEGLAAKVMSVTEFESSRADTVNAEGINQVYLKQESLVFTDSALICRSALSENGCVSAFLHEGNRNEDFSGVSYAAESLADLSARYFERIYKRLTGKPWEILQTKRCILRETVEEDADAFYEIYAEPSVTEYTEPPYADKEKEKQYIRDYRDCYYRFYEFGIWTVLEKSTGRVIGRAGVNLRDGYDIPEIGFVIGAPWQRQGYAYEICMAILDYVRDELGMNELQALVMPENKASAGLCRKLGFQAKGEVETNGCRYAYFYYSAGKKES